QGGRLLELPILAALVMMAGLWLGGYHPAGYLLAALPILLFLLFFVAHSIQRARIPRRRRVMRERLPALQAEGFNAQLVCEGDLACRDAWAAFDAAKGEAKVIAADGVRSYALAALASIRVENAPIGPEPLHYLLSLYFGDPQAPFRPELS